MISISNMKHSQASPCISPVKKLLITSKTSTVEITWWELITCLLVKINCFVKLINRKIIGYQSTEIIDNPDEEQISVTALVYKPGWEDLASRRIDAPQ